MFEILNTSQAANLIGSIMGYTLATAVILSFLGLIFTAIASVIKILVAPIEFAAKVAEKAAQKAQVANEARVKIERESFFDFNQYNLADKPYRHLSRPHIHNEEPPPGFRKI